MPAKTQQLQIRVTPQEKAALKRQARAAGQDVSSYVLSRLVAGDRERFIALLAALAHGGDHRFALAELNDFLSGCTSGGFADAVARAELTRLSPLLQNYVAAMVELAAAKLGAEPPAWCRDVELLDAPYFAAPLASLRMHLLQAAPVAFKRRNIFVDASVGARV